MVFYREQNLIGINALVSAALLAFLHLASLTLNESDVSVMLVG